MKTANLRKVGGSTMVAIPTDYLKELGIKAGEPISMRMENGELICHRATPRYTLKELLAQTPEGTSEDIRASGWLDEKPEGNESL